MKSQDARIVIKRILALLRELNLAPTFPKHHYAKACHLTVNFNFCIHILSSVSCYVLVSIDGVTHGTGRPEAE